MTRFAKFFFGFVVALLLLWQVPWAINYLWVKPIDTPFTLYSEQLNDFVMIQRTDEGPTYCDRKGKEYTREEFDALLPLFYARQLVADGRFPEQIAGRTVSPREAQMGNFVFRSSPKEVNKPTLGLYFMMETLSGRVDLEMPDDAFRLTDRGIEFIDMETNSVKEEKSARFSDMLLKKGARFPIRTIAGNPTSRKEYDEGYVLLDADGRLFHVKMVRERPYVRAVTLPEGVELEHLFITEFRSRRTLALMTDREHHLYALAMPGYEIKRVEGVEFDPTNDDMSILGTLFNWTVCVTDADAERYYAINADDFSLLDSMSFPLDQSHVPGLSFTSPNDQFVRLRIQ